MLKLVIYTSLAMDSNLKLQSLVENTVIVGQFFCLVRDVDNTFIFIAFIFKEEIFSLDVCRMLPLRTSLGFKSLRT